MTGDEAYKARKEAFVTGHGGTTMAEVMLQAATPALCLFFHRVLAAARPSLGVDRSFALSFALLGLPAVLAQMVPEAAPWIAAAAAAGSAAVIALGPPEPTSGGASAAESLKALRTARAAAAERPPFLTHFRACVMLLTVVAILAVDFTPFPRRFAKTEEFGTSLMDAGVGAFVVSSGLSAGRAPTLAGEARGSWYLLLIGGASALAKRGVNYQEHVSEYGVHWNFFVTLAALRLLRGLFRVPPRLGLASGAALAAAYETALRLGGLQEYVLRAPRDSLLSANREGLCSTAGFFALHLAATQAGAFVRRRGDRAAPAVALCSLALWAVLLASGALPSRRMANLAYVAWTLAQSLALLALFMLADAVTHSAAHFQASRGGVAPADAAAGVAPARALAAVSRSQFAVFLAANLCTGAVNLSARTLDTPPAVAVAVVTAYAVAVLRFAWWLYSTTRDGGCRYEVGAAAADPAAAAAAARKRTRTR